MSIAAGDGDSDGARGAARDQEAAEKNDDRLPGSVASHREAKKAAFDRISRNRRRLTQAQAEAIIREEAAARGVHVASHVVREEAQIWTRPFWRLLLPRRTRR